MVTDSKLSTYKQQQSINYWNNEYLTFALTVLLESIHQTIVPAKARSLRTGVFFTVTDGLNFYEFQFYHPWIRHCMLFLFLNSPVPIKTLQHAINMHTIYFKFYILLHGLFLYSKFWRSHVIYDNDVSRFIPRVDRTFQM